MRWNIPEEEEIVSDVYIKIVSLIKTYIFIN